jgi:hypothetical protein
MDTPPGGGAAGGASVPTLDPLLSSETLPLFSLPCGCDFSRRGFFLLSNRLRNFNLFLAAISGGVTTCASGSYAKRPCHGLPS